MKWSCLGSQEGSTIENLTNLKARAKESIEGSSRRMGVEVVRDTGRNNMGCIK
jgi:hypothetical protein